MRVAVALDVRVGVAVGVRVGVAVAVDVRVAVGVGVGVGEDVGVRVGLDVDLVKRLVARLRDQGYLRIAGETVTIPDVGALRTLFNLLGAKEEIRGERGV